jgi:hypothetical protein
MREVFCIYPGKADWEGLLGFTFHSGGATGL